MQQYSTQEREKVNNGGGNSVTSPLSSQHRRWTVACATAFVAALFVCTPQHAQCHAAQPVADTTARHDTVIGRDTLVILPVGAPVEEGDTVVFE